MLSCEDIARILDRKLAIYTGRKPGFNRNHLLFYSPPDDNFFVAIQDGLTGTVVTILPLDYHANLAWTISPEDCAKAKKLCIDAPAEDTRTKDTHTKDIQTLPTPNATVFVISGRYIDREGNQKTKVIQKLDSAQYEHDVKRLLSDQAFFSNLDALAADKGIDVRNLFGITIRLGNKGAGIPIDIQEVPSPNKSRP